MVAGVAGGLAERYDLDPALVRTVWAILVIPTGGAALLVYLIMAFVVPEAEPESGLPSWMAGGSASPWPPSGSSPAGVTPSAADPARPGNAPPPPPPPSGGWAGLPGPGAGPGTGPSAGPGTGPSAGPGTGPAGPAAPGGPPAGRPGTASWTSRRARRDDDRGGTIALGLILVGVGGWFLVRQLFPSFDLGAAWPVVAVVAGAVLVFGSLRPRRRDG
jgi:phage shock protein PspC (stress-responsive transcriptional regulator)